MTDKKDEKFEYNDEFCGECGCGVDCEDSHKHHAEDIEFVDMDDDDVCVNPHNQDRKTHV